VVRWSACACWIGAGKAQFLQIEFFDEGIDGANWIVFGDVVIQRSNGNVA
jgi:hypothetical protein